MNFLRTGAKRFAPHQFSNRVAFIGPSPRILLTRGAYDTQYYIVDEAPEEVGWLGTVKREGMNFLIEEVFLFEQEVSGTQTKLDEEAVGKFFAELASQPGGIEKANSIRFWGHSQHHMGTNPSGSYGADDYGDLAQMFRFGDAADYFVMGIFDKAGHIRFDIYFYDLGVKVEDVEWNLYEPEQAGLRERIKAELKAKVRRAPTPVVAVGFGGYDYGGYSGYSYSTTRVSSQKKGGGKKWHHR